MPLTPFPGTDQYQVITVSGLYDNNTESPLFAAVGATAPTSGILVGGIDSSGNFQTVTTTTFGSPAVVAQNVYVVNPAAMVAPVDQGNQGTIAESWFVELTNGTVVIGTVANPLYVQGTVTALQGTSPWVVSLTSTTITGTVAVTQSTSPWVVAGNLTNNNAAPAANNLGVLGFVAESAYTNLTYTTGDQVLAVTDIHGAINDDLQAVAGVQLGATGVTAFGTAPAAVNVPGVNANIYQAGAAISVTNTLFNQISDGTSAMGTMANFGTNPGAVKSLNTNSFVFNTTAAPIFASGTLTNNNAAPAANNLGVLGFEATATPLAYTQGDQVLATTSLGGAVRVVPVDEANASSLSYFADDSGFTTLITLPNATLVPVISVQSNSAAFIFLVREVTGYGDGSQIKFVLIKNAQTLTGSAFTTTGIPTGSHIKRDVTATAVTIGTGTVVWSSMAATAPAHNEMLMNFLAAGTPGDTYTLAAQKFGSGTSKAFGSIRWSEQSAAL